MKQFTKYLIFFALNFGALALGGLFTNSGVNSDWYAELNKAPWTPPGWVFGAAWATIMLCYSIYMAIAWNRIAHWKIGTLFGLQLILNIGWNPVFFYHRDTLMGLVVITALTLLILLKITAFSKQMRYSTILLAPYFIWLCIATSLNLYIVLFN